MRSWQLLAGSLLLVPFFGCQNDKAKETAAANAAASAQAAAASAQAAPALAAAASAQALAATLTAQAATKITGNVHSVGGELGTFDIVLTSCQSGEVNGFFGADFYAPGSDEMRLRYVHDEAKGDIVKVAIPSKKSRALSFDRSDKCTVLEGSVEKTNVSTATTKGKIRHLDGHVKFDCTYTPGGGHVTGEVTFSHCH
jgi:hypothetical protein